MSRLRLLLASLSGLVPKGGTIHDVSDRAAFVGDVAITGNRVSHVARVAATVKTSAPNCGTACGGGQRLIRVPQAGYHARGIGMAIPPMASVQAVAACLALAG